MTGVRPGMRRGTAAHGPLVLTMTDHHLNDGPPG